MPTNVSARQSVQAWKNLNRPNWFILHEAQAITVVMLEPGRAERQAVLSQIYKMDEKDFNQYFLHSMFTGELHAAPKALGSSTEVLKFVFNIPGAIGYLKSSEVNDSVKVVRIDSRLPGEKDYAIRLHGRPAK